VIHEGPSFATLESSPWPPGGDDVAIAALLDLLEETAPDVAAHVDRTARLARLVGLELGVREAVLQLVVQTARLHDIGKLAVPPWILEKAEPLSESERAVVRRLPVIGQRILERRPALSALGSLVRSVHERWDGTGFPDGLRGAAIPLPSRVVAVCDAFDAMTTARPHSAPVPVARAIEELRRCAGTQFDPDAARALAELLERHIDRRVGGA
jgi:HD-GYP domain-containing protein (c-di-GMP phosphodiesterase class II)